MPGSPVCTMPQPSSTLVMVESSQHVVTIQNEGHPFVSDSDEELGIILLDHTDQITTEEISFKQTSTAGEIALPKQPRTQGEQATHETTITQKSQDQIDTTHEGTPRLKLPNHRSVDANKTTNPSTHAFQNYFKSAKTSLLTILTLTHLRLRTKATSTSTSVSNSNPEANPDEPKQGASPECQQTIANDQARETTAFGSEKTRLFDKRDLKQESNINRNVLQPDEQKMKLEDIPWQSKNFYVLVALFYVVIFVTLVVVTHEQVHNSFEFILDTFIFNFGINFGIQYLAGILRVFIDFPAAYTRKMWHISVYSIPFIIDSIFNNLNDDDATITLIWNWWTVQFQIGITMCPVRYFFDKYVIGGSINDETIPIYKRLLNAPSLIFAAFERVEDRPNTLKWMQIQIYLSYLFFMILAGFDMIIHDNNINNRDKSALESLILIATIVGGFGDGLAEVIGRKYGQNHQFKVRGCCSEYDYVRSVHGSLMVWISGVVAVAVNHNEFTRVQMIIAFIIIPIIGTMTEAKAPHTLDNPFIILLVGLSVLIVILLPV